MFLLYYFIVTLLVFYIDAVACLAIDHKFNPALSFISALFWWATCPLVIYKVYQHQKEN